MNKMARILVTGGAGYIGSICAYHLLQAGHDVVVVDDLSRGHRHNVAPERLRQVNILDTGKLTEILAAQPFDAVMHFAAYIAVGESVESPELYFANNVGGAVSLFRAMRESGVSRLVFSSTAAVYGHPSRSPITEAEPIAPVNPYGESKAAVERMLGWLDRASNLRSVSLRYFNACGADADSGLGEQHDPETHLIPLLLRAVHTGKPATLFGDDYPTADGTCIRDYIHVTDLARAHVLALEYLLDGGATVSLNVGTGRGHSVREVVEAAGEACGRPVPYNIGPRRAGDSPELVADPARLKSLLGWQPRCTDLREIASSAWEFFTRRAK